MDRYSKAALTVIAAVLIVIAAENAIRGAVAQNDTIQKVAICDVHGLECVAVTNFALLVDTH
ncbi:MAG: hypothetical protein ACRD33_06500 [Candidatus Acidiferrales bacterium]